jgi:3',5'-cyclic AMP phosphodiesterase CpdA
LRTYFTGYDLYAMVMPSVSSRADLASFRFFKEAAMSTHTRGLVLMPVNLDHNSILQIVDPFPALRTLAEHPIAPPAVVFWTRLQHSCALPLEEAKQFFQGLEKGLAKVDRALKQKALAQHTKRILHLSDLHFGTKEAGRRRRWLKESLTKELKSADRVVVTGDLFDKPEEALRESFDEFQTDLENITHKDLIVIPGNHDVRRKGNALGPFGRNSGYVSDLPWDQITVDDDLQTIFLPFNSGETGNWAKGFVGERQRLDRSFRLSREVRRRPELKKFLRIALVHHHPYPYGSEPTALYERLIARLFGGDEKFVAFKGAQAFMKWCAAQKVTLVLHGHKHVPHIKTVNLAGETITVVGCGSTTGVDGRPMCYDVIKIDPSTNRSNVFFYHDQKGDGSGFTLQNVAVDLRD